MYKTYESLNLAEINKNIKLDNPTNDKNKEDYATCYDGPPSVSGLPGIHHILSRTLKDIFCRFNYLKGKSIYNKSGWDTHGLPVELRVEKDLNITKKDIGTKISVKDYNTKCRNSVNEYTDKWKELTRIHGYCTEIDDPYITCDKKYIESEWWAFRELYKKGYIYQDYSIQPYSPMAGTGLSSHELNQPGCYRLIKDLTVTAMFKFLSDKNTYFIAWTTTPWTLPANSALAVNKNIIYVKIKCKNQYSNEEINVILAKEALSRYFKDESEYSILAEYKGYELIGKKYEQLFAFVKPEKKSSFFNIFKKDNENIFKVIPADFVTTTDGTGIVHISPSFGVDDRRVAKQNNIDEITVTRNNKKVPIVDEEGRFVEEITTWKGIYVRKEYYKEDDPNIIDVNVEIVKNLKSRGLCFKSEKHEHSYPHCWRTDKPLIYYPLKTWFIKTTAVKDKLVEFNDKIKWHPKSTGEGRFKNWLENIVDWNVSRNRFWGVPIPIWISDDGNDIKCIGSYEELKNEIEKANKILKLDQKADLEDIHKPYIDEIILVSDDNCKRLKRVPEVLDVWFDSGAMPFAQFHYPFENKEEFFKHFPADFICEGVDQTRGWFFTLHILSVILFDKPAYKNVVSNGLVLDKNGDKMSKRLGNAIDPFELFEKYGSDAVRWYMIINSDPWENLKFDIEGVKEVSRKFFSTLFNTYNFFAIYYNCIEDKIKDINGKINSIYNNDQNKIDKWILSRLNSVIKEVDDELSKYNPTKAARAINDFVINDLSNWYVRLNRKRFSRNDDLNDCALVFKILKECLEKTSTLIYPFTPFFSKWLKSNLDTQINPENN